MRRAEHNIALEQVVERLEHLIGSTHRELTYLPPSPIGRAGRCPDLIVEIGTFRFIIEYCSSPLLAHIAYDVQLLKEFPAQSEIRLLAVPFMGESGRQKCREAGISWVDLSGNADVTAPGLRLYITGEKNCFLSPGRQENPFAPKSSRVARRLLYQPHRSWSQRELSEETGLGEGYVSRIVKSLEDQQLVFRDQGRLRIGNCSLMLDAWLQGYDFKSHEVIRGHVTGRTGEEVQTKVSRILKEMNLEHAATGLGAAWLYSGFAAFRTVSFYIKDWPKTLVLDEMRFRQDSPGANLWLIIPKDADVFYDLKWVGDVPCAHEIQVWLDLKSHPERAEEAAAELRGLLEM